MLYSARLLIAQSELFSNRRAYRLRLRCGGFGSQGFPAILPVLTTSNLGILVAAVQPLLRAVLDVAQLAHLG